MISKDNNQKRRYILPLSILLIAIFVFVLFKYVLSWDAIHMIERSSFMISLVILLPFVVLTKINFIYKNRVLFLFFAGILSMLIYGFANNSWDTGKSEDPDAAYFSVWDGSNPELVKMVKSSMHDADSFEHVSTGTLPIDDDHIKIEMKYKGTNLLGGVVTTTVVGVFEKSTRTITDIKLKR